MVDGATCRVNKKSKSSSRKEDEVETRYTFFFIVTVQLLSAAMATSSFHIIIMAKLEISAVSVGIFDICLTEMFVG